MSEKSALSYEREGVMKGHPIVKTATKLPTFFSHKIAMFPWEKRAAFEMRMEFSRQQMCSWTSLTRMKSTLVSQQLLRQFSDNCIVFRNNEDIVHYFFCVCCRICWEIKFWHMSRANLKKRGWTKSAGEVFKILLDTNCIKIKQLIWSLALS